jgi:hypothetical protein
MTPSGYNGTYTVGSSTTNTLTVPQAVNPGAATVMGTVQATWVNGDNFIIGDGATLTINTSSGAKRMGMNGSNNQNVLTINNGRLLISNSSNVSAIRVTWAQIASTAGARILNIANGLGLIEIQGNYIEIGTGDGSSGQTMTLPYTDFSPCVMVETGNGTGVFEPWMNIGNIPSLSPQTGIIRGFTPASDERGKVFIQTPANISALTQAGINATTLFTNQITFGTGVNGMKVPIGARVRVPNIVLTDESDRTTYSHPTFANHGNITMLGGGRFIANWCNFGYMQLDATGAQQVELSYCSFTLPPIFVRCSPQVNTVGICPILTYPTYLSSAWGFTEISATQRTWSQISDASFTRLCYAIDSTQLDGGSSVGQAILVISYSDSVVLNDCLFRVQERRRQDDRLLVFSNCTNVTGSGNQFLGGPVYFVTSSVCNLSNTKWSNRVNDISTTSNNSCNILFNPATGNRLVNGTRYYVKVLHRRGLTQNPQFNADQEGYWLTQRVYSATPYIGGANHPSLFGATPRSNSVVLRWPRTDPNTTQLLTLPIGALTCVGTTATAVLPTGHGYITGDEIIVAGATPAGYNGTFTVTAHTATSVSYTVGSTLATSTTTATIRLRICYQIYRSTSFGSLGSLLTSIYTVASTVISNTEYAVEVYDDTTAVNNTTYFYTLRKFDAPGVYTDSAQQEATPTADESSVTNLILQSSTLDNASWTKTSATIAGNSARTPLVNSWTNATADADTITPTGDASVAQVVSATAGTTYTFSIYARVGGHNGANPFITTQLQISDNGSTPQTTTQAITLDGRMQRFWVTHTASTGTTQITCRIGGSSTLTSGKIIQAGAAQLVTGSVPGPLIGPTTTASLSTTPWLMDTTTTTGASGIASGIAAVASESGGEITCRVSTTPANASAGGYIEIHVGTTPDFTPSYTTLAWSSLGIAVNTETPVYALGFFMSSNDNVINGLTQVGVTGFNGSASSIVYFDGSSRNRVLNTTVDIRGGGSYVSVYFVKMSTNSSFNNLVHNLTMNNFTEMQRVTTVSPLIDLTTNINAGLTIQNVKSNSGFIRTHSWLQNGVKVKGCFGARTYAARTALTDVLLNPNTGQSTELVLTACFDTMFAETYDSTTTGALTLHMTGATSNIPYTIISGNPSFDNGGGLLLGTVGDSIEFEWPHTIFGVSGFRTLDLGRSAGLSCFLGSAVSVGAIGDPTNNYGLKLLSAIKIEYAINTGSSYGALKELTNENLTAESVSATTGFRIKVRFTAMRAIQYTGKVTNFVQGETINGQTSGATAVIDRIIETPAYLDARGSTTGLLWVSNVTGLWGTASENIRSGVTVRAVTSSTTANVILPIKNQAANNTIIRGLRLFTNIDQSVLYSASTNTVTVNNVVSGSRILIRNTTTQAILINAIVSGTSYSYTYDSTTPIPVEIVLRKSSSAPYYKQWRTTSTLSTSNQNITALQETD